MATKRTALCLGVLLSFFAVSVQAAVVYLKDGAQVSGTVVSATARDIQVHTATGMQRIDTDRIDRIDYNARETVVPPTPSAPWIYERAETHQIFNLNFGAAFPLTSADFSSVGGGSSKNGGSGILLGTQYLYELSPQLATGLQFDYFNRGARDDLNLVPFADTNIWGDTVLLMGVAKYTFTRHGRTRPYILAGVGGNHTSEMVDATPLIGFAWSDTNTGETRRLVDDSSWGLATTARLGLDFDVMSPTVLSFEIGWTGLFNPNYEPTPAGRDLGLTSISGTIHALTVSLRCGWRF